jgi:hypothetical protein
LELVGDICLYFPFLLFAYISPGVRITANAGALPVAFPEAFSAIAREIPIQISPLRACLFQCCFMQVFSAKSSLAVGF